MQREAVQGRGEELRCGLCLRGAGGIAGWAGLRAGVGAAASVRLLLLFPPSGFPPSAAKEEDVLSTLRRTFLAPGLRLVFFKAALLFGIPLPCRADRSCDAHFKGKKKKKKRDT